MSMRIQKIGELKRWLLVIGRFQVELDATMVVITNCAHDF